MLQTNWNWNIPTTFVNLISLIKQNVSFLCRLSCGHERRGPTGPLRMLELEWNNSICSKWICFVRRKKRIWNTKRNVWRRCITFCSIRWIGRFRFSTTTSESEWQVFVLVRQQRRHGKLSHKQLFATNFTSNSAQKKQIELKRVHFPFVLDHGTEIPMIINGYRWPEESLKPIRAAKSNPIIILKIAVVHWISPFSQPSNPGFKENYYLRGERKTWMCSAIVTTATQIKQWARVNFVFICARMQKSPSLRLVLILTLWPCSSAFWCW